MVGKSLIGKPDLATENGWYEAKPTVHKGIKLTIVRSYIKNDFLQR